MVQREVKEGLEDSSRHDHVDHMSVHIVPASRNEKIYEAYNDLHSLAQGFHKPFDSPAILVVGHQSDGKSALLEALMGFQFNHVGGGTKTRRPITLHMKYNSTCVQPRCFLVTEDRPPVEEERRLEEIQVTSPNCLPSRITDSLRASIFKYFPFNAMSSAFHFTLMQYLQEMKNWWNEILERSLHQSRTKQ